MNDQHKQAKWKNKSLIQLFLGFMLEGKKVHFSSPEVKYPEVIQHICPSTLCQQ